MKRKLPLIERFAAKFTRGHDWSCWEWHAAKTYDGRGIFKLDTSLPRGAPGGTITAPRMAYILAHGDIPEGLVVMHECDNPGCVNPRHLRLGTQTENVRDMINKQRAGWQRKAA